MEGKIGKARFSSKDLAKDVGKVAAKGFDKTKDAEACVECTAPH